MFDIFTQLESMDEGCSLKTPETLKWWVQHMVFCYTGSLRAGEITLKFHSALRICPVIWHGTTDFSFHDKL